MTSLSEIQSLLQTSEAPQRRPAAKPAPTEAAPAAPATIGAPVPSAAEIRATREARWQEEMAEAQRTRAPAARGVAPLTWILVSVALVGGVAAGWMLWPQPAPPPAPAAEPGLAVATPAPPSAEAVVPAPPPSAAAVAPSAGANVAEAAPPTSAAPRKVAARSTSRSAATHASRQRASAIDAAFGPRPTQSRGKIVAKPKVKRKRTRADSQLDSVLDGL